MERRKAEKQIWRIRWTVSVCMNVGAFSRVYARARAGAYVCVCVCLPSARMIRVYVLYVACVTVHTANDDAQPFPVRGTT